MKLSELIAAIGDDNIKLQNLDQCSTTLDYSAKRGTKITFGTEEPLTPNGTVRLGLVVWLDRSKVAELIDASKADGTGTGGNSEKHAGGAK